MFSALVSGHGLMKEIYSCLARLFGSWINEGDIFVFSALVSGHGLKNEIYSCSAQVARPSPGH